MLNDEIIKLIAHCGDDPARAELVDTPANVAAAWQEICSGYQQNPRDILNETMPAGAQRGMEITLTDIEFYSMCEHHMLPFIGTITVSYVPQDKIIGLGKIARLVDCLSRRLTIQERLTQDLVDHLAAALQPQSLDVTVAAEHFCLALRGAKKAGSRLITRAVWPKG